MKLGMIPLFLGLTLALPAEAQAPSPSRQLFLLWSSVRQPLSGPQNPIGTYAAGCLAGADRLPLDGPGFSVMRPSRNRFFGHHNLVAFIEGLGEKLKSQHLPRLLVGDMGGPRGGPMITGHSSHQIGLDVDLWYRMSRRQPTKRERETWAADSFVSVDNTLRRGWNDSYRKLLAAAAESPQVERIFVHPVIKRDLCEKFANAPWLYKFRAWWGHADHLHVRLHCPPGGGCQAQEPLDPKNNQCGQELAWWFSAEAKEEGQKKEAAFAERVFPELPKDCARVIEGKSE